MSKAQARIDHEQAVSAAELIFALNVTDAGLVITDPERPDNPIIYVNEGFTRMTGYSPEEAIGRNPRFLQGPETDSADVRRMGEGVAQHRAFEQDIINYRKSGEAFWMRVSIRPLYDQNGRVQRYVGWLRDASHDKEAEAGLEQSRRLELVLRGVPVPIISVGRDGSIRDLNPSASTFMGVAPEAVRGEPFWSYLPRGMVPLTPGEFEARLCRNGVETWILGAVQQVEVGGERLWLVAFQDNTAHKRHEAQLQSAREEAERQIRVKMHFFAAASHDLRQPIQALALFVTAIESRVQEGPLLPIIESMKTSLKTMEEMFDSLMDMSKLDAGVLKPKIEEFIINDLLDALGEEFAPQAEAAGLELRLVPSSVTVLSDRRMLGRILRNLLQNSIRYTESGRILLGCRRRGDKLHIAVCDTGVGIEQEQAERIFNEFYQVEGSERSGGQGLGLAIVQRLATLLGHRVELRSVRGKGSMFGIEVPLIEE